MQNRFQNRAFWPLAVAAAAVGVPLWVAACPAAVHAQEAPAQVPMRLLTKGGAPFTDSLSEIVKRDGPYQEAIKNRRIPPPPKAGPNIFDDDEKAEFVRPPVIDGASSPGEEGRFAPPPLAGRIDASGHFIPAADASQRRASAARSAAVEGDPIPVLPTPSAPQNLGTNFGGPTLGTVGGWIPPDTQGAVGPNHVMMFVNGGVGIYNKTTGAQISLVSLASFFAMAGNGYPRNGAFDPRVVYDRRSGRWFATGMEFGSPSQTDNDVILAVSRTSDPTGTWDKYVIPVGIATDATYKYFTDYSTLGVDDNGVYIGTRIFRSNVGSSSVNASWNQIVATPKSNLVGASPGLGGVFLTDNIASMGGTPQPAFNLDGSSSGRAWFVASDGFLYSDGSGGVVARNVVYRTLTWSGSTPSLDASNTTLATPNYEASPPDAPQSGGASAVDTGDNRVQMAIIRNNQLWLARTIGVNLGGGHTAGFDSRNAAPLSACEWLSLNVSGATASLLQSGRVYDPTGTMFYFYPSLTVSGQGHVAMGFSGSSAGTFVSAYTCGRLSSDATGTMQAIQLFKAGSASYFQSDGANNRWGDYSYTALDPNDDQTLWTFQEYASGLNAWGIWAQRLLAPAPTLTGLVSPVTAVQGQRGVTLRVNGTGLWDPGAGFASRIGASFSGTGISNVRVFYSSATSVIVQCDVDPAAATGTRTLTVTNPDGQSSATLSNALTIAASAAPSVGASVTGAARSSTIDLTLTVRNSGGATATGVRITGATVTVGANTTNTTTPLPAPSASGLTLAAGASGTIGLSFPASAGTTGQTYTLRYLGLSAAGSFTGVFTGTLP